MEPISTTEPSPTSRLEPKAPSDKFSTFTYAGSTNSVPPFAPRFSTCAVEFKI